MLVELSAYSGIKTKRANQQQVSTCVWGGVGRGRVTLLVRLVSCVS